MSSKRNHLNEWSDLRAHWAEHSKRERAQREAWTTNAMLLIRDQIAAMRKDAGWQPIGRYPEQGKLVLAWDPMQAPYPATYRDGCWSAEVDGDVWLAHPVLWKPLPDGWTWESAIPAQRRARDGGEG